MLQSQCSGRALAFLGDAVWSLKVRMYLLESGITNGKKLQKESISYVNAKAQAALYQSLHDEGFFTEEEEDVFHRGRNSHEGSVPKSTDVQTYRMSTGFEAILGALELAHDEERIHLIFQRALELRK